MEYLIIFLYIVPAIYLYTEASEEPELVEGFRWMLPVFCWPVCLPLHMITVFVYGPNGDEDE